MINGKSVLGLITARGGSKGIPRKNVKDLAGKPLIQWTIEPAQESKFIDRLIVSSDSAEILMLSNNLGCETLPRPEHLARDETSSIDTILHAVDQVSPSYDYLILLQPTSPFRTTSDIDGILQKAVGSDCNVMVSVCRLKTHPMFIYEIIEGKLRSFQPQRTQLRRQDTPPVYAHNGALYVAKIPVLISEKTFNLPDTEPYITEGRINLDIDTTDDWEYAKFLMKEG